MSARQICRDCGVTLEREGNHWVDAAEGGSYDWCDYGKDNAHHKAVTR